MTKEPLIQILRWIDYTAIGIGAAILAVGTYWVCTTKPNGTVAGLQAIMFSMAGLATLLFSLLICGIMP